MQAGPSNTFPSHIDLIYPSTHHRPSEALQRRKDSPYSPGILQLPSSPLAGPNDPLVCGLTLRPRDPGLRGLLRSDRS